jgi:flagellar motor component MotA
MNTIKDHSFLLLEEIPLVELPEGVAEIVDDYRHEGLMSMDEAMNAIEECFGDEMLQWIQTNNELAEIFPEDEE